MTGNKTLIAYVTKQKASKEAATKIAEILKTKYGSDIDLVDLNKQEKSFSIDKYTNVIVGAGVRGGKVYGKALDFLKKDLDGKKIAFFVCSSWAGTPGSYENAKARFVDKLLAKYPNLNIVGAEAFGGRIRYLGKTMLDNTNLDRVELWADDIGKRFAP